MTSNNTQGKKSPQQSHQADSDKRPPVSKQERDFESLSQKFGKSTVGAVSESEMDTLSHMADSVQITSKYFDEKIQFQDETDAHLFESGNVEVHSFPSLQEDDMNCTEHIQEMESGPMKQTIESKDETEQSNNDSYFDNIKECQISKDEMGNISVKNMAKFWEEVSKTIKDEAAKTEPKIQKKWNSMPDLKDRYEKRKLPARPTQEKIQQLENLEDSLLMPEPVSIKRQVVKSDEVIDDVDLCRSVSIRDRKQMFEMMATQARKEKKKQWSSMPSLKQERNLPQPRQSSPEKGKVHWKEDVESEEEEYIHDEPSLRSRGRSPIKEIMKTFEVNKSRQSSLSVSKPNEISNRHSHSRLKSPVSPLLHTNEIFNYKDDFNSSSDSVSSSLTSSSTVVARSPGIPSMLEDSGGEIYTDGSKKALDEHGLFVVENGTEFSLTPVNKRKSMFEIHKKSGRVRKISKETKESKRTDRVSETQLEIPTEISKESEMQSLERIKSSSIPYIEEEKDILENIRMVQSLKMKFLK